MNTLKAKLLIPLMLLFFISGFESTAQVTEPEMVLVEGGSFLMGSDEGDDDEKPIYERKVSTFYMSKYEITVGQYREFCEETGWAMPEETPEWGWHDNYPMVLVSWKDAGAYSLWLARKTGKKYRLPTEIEWEYAARGGKKTKGYQYSGSESAEEVAWYYESTYGSSPQPVGLLKPNELDIYDMSGNVWEWCKDEYSLQYYSDREEAQLLASGPTGENYRVLRGGGWKSDVVHTRVANRLKNVPASTSNEIGFRVVYIPE